MRPPTVRRALLSLIASCAAACGSSSAKSGDGSSDHVNADGPVVVDSTNDAVVGAETNPDFADIHGYPRVYADPTLTRRIVEAPAELVGGDACSNGLPPTGDQWCAFSRRRPDERVELWVFNASRAASTGSADCTSASPNCFRLTENLWTGIALWGPSHPYSHRFDGDTLIFHADAPARTRQPYEGPIFAWRPGWPAARRISTERGVACTGHRRSPVAFCIDAADVDTNPTSPFSQPTWKSFDVLVGRLATDGAESLARVDRVSPGSDGMAFRARFDNRGDTFAYSSVLPEDRYPTLNVVTLTETDVSVPKPIIADANFWEIAHDGKVVYFLRDYDSVTTGSGTLTMASLPDGANAITIAPKVVSLELLGAHDDVFTDEDKGIGFTRLDEMGRRAFEIMADRASPTVRQSVGVGIDVAQVSIDRKFTFFFEENDLATFRVAKVARNDGSGSCSLNIDLDAETYGAHFSAAADRVFWIEFGSSGSEEGWTAKPDTCDQRVKFGDWVLGYVLLDDDLVLFEGGDEDDHTSFLQYSWLNPPGDTRPVSPRVFDEGPTYPIQVIRSTAGPHVMYGRLADTPPAIYLHGPLTRPPNQPGIVADGGADAGP